ncbi:nuclear pore complex protein Nup205 [Saccoglossus kowalevskii]|uniref:Nuclear pore complex protein Nup205 n=1 Tax=Saccoglossus kowalevskii TaxID=10224 RepID=A0ABM0GZA2_SACKO|nr:PREDICTED: nuclear pore complex protein Nup205 [Saccoglossus kowalevskii]
MAERVAVNLASSLWKNYKDLRSTVEAAIEHKQLEAFHDLEVSLKKYKPDFISLLKNPAKNAQHCDQIRKGPTEGITMEGQNAPFIIPASLVDETLVFSNLFDINEFTALEFLLTGEQQQSQFPGLPRGLVAVLLYYDTKNSLVHSLRTLIQAREGKTWTLGLPEDLMIMVTKFTDQLIEEGLLNKVLGLLQSFDETKEVDKLQRERALGNSKHRKQVFDLIKEIRTGLSDCLFCMACQSRLNNTDTVQLVNYFEKCSPLKSDGCIDDVHLGLVMTFMYAMDVSILEQAIEDKEDIANQLPILADSSYVPDVHNLLFSEDEWSTPGLKAVLQFVWGVALRNIAQQPGSQDIQDYIEEDEAVIDVALSSGVFQFMKNSIIASKTFHNEEFYVRCLHALVTDFIIQMPLKVKELRNRGDEAARIVLTHTMEGLESPANLRRDFEHFMLLLGELYGKDPLKLQLPFEYWCPGESSVSPIAGFAGHYHHRPPHRQVSLYKFVRIAGDLLPPSLYVPYIKMLTGLANGPQCAHHCFNLLKANGISAGGNISSVSWDHFFMSINQYYTNLRHEIPSLHDTHIYRHTASRGITPQELDGLMTVLKLMQQIARQDDAARIALCENQSWLPIVLLFGLLSCSVPPILKGELLHTLAALGKSPEVAATLWQSLEVSQILPTVSSATASGIQVELDEVEARNEEFPMLLGFLDFMNTLTDIPVPASLGAGFRAPGFDPYLDFLRDVVFLKFNTRAYRNPADKWQVAADVLEILLKLLRDYRPQAEDFIDQQVEIQGGGMVLTNKPPGYNLLIHMLNDSPLLKLILFVVHEATRLLDQYTEFPGKSSLQKATLLCLKMIEITLEKQEIFMDLLREFNSSILVASMDKLLMGINTRTGKADHLVNIAKYVTYNSFNPELTLSSIKILYWVTQSSVYQPALVGMLTANKVVAGDILHGFVECLEIEDLEEVSCDTSDDTDENELSSGDVRNAARQHIMHVILYSLDHPAPNLAHFLLGYELTKPVCTSNLQEPGVLGSPRSCLHAVLSLVNRGVESRTGPTCVYNTPRFAELAYKLIYALCVNKDTSNPTMRFLRATHDFFLAHLQHLPFRPKGELTILNQQSWLLKSVAMEIKMTAANRQRSHTQRLLRMLLEDTQTVSKEIGGKLETSVDGDGMFGMDSHLLDSTTISHARQAVTGMQVRRKILCILDTIDLEQDAPLPLRLDFLNPGTVERVISTFDEKNEYGVTVCNIKLLHEYLVQELNTLQGSAAAGQRPLIQQEIERVLKNVVARNSVRQHLASKKHSFESWRHVTEVMLTACPLDVLKPDTRRDVIVELLQDLLRKVSNPDARQELVAPIAGVILTLMVNLRQSIVHDHTDTGATEYISMLETSNVSTLASQSAIMGSATSLTASPLVVVLRGLIEFIMQSSGGQQRVRTNLYGALLNFLQLPQKPKEMPGVDDDRSPVLDSAQLTEYEKQIKTNISVITSYGENFMEMVCRDSCDGHDVGKMLAISVLDTIISFDKHQRWLSFLTSKGYLRHIMESILQDDETLQNTLKPLPEPLKALYIYESKMSLLTRLAKSPGGAQELLHSAVMNKLSNCKFLSLRPEQDMYRMRSVSGDADGMEDHSFVPSLMARYRQLLFPALKLAIAIMTSLGIQHREAANQVLQFIISHSDVFNGIMRDHHVQVSLPALQELALTTAVIYRTVPGGENAYREDQSQLEYQGHISRIQRQMLSLIPRYCCLDHWTKKLKNVDSSIAADGKDKKDEISEALLEISSNVIAYSRAVVSMSGLSSEQCLILFTASLVEARSRELHTMEDMQMFSVTGGRPPSLGVIVRFLKQCTSVFIPALESHKQYIRKLQHINELAPEELRELALSMGVSNTDKMSTHQRQSLAASRLSQIVQHKAKQLTLYYYIVENSIFLLWRHLEFYFLHCQPSDSSSAMFSMPTIKSGKPRRLQGYPGLSDSEYEDSSLYEGMSKLIGAMEGVTQEDLEQLKGDAIACLNEPFFEKTLKVDECYGKSRTRYGFVPAVVRRIRRLLKLHIG